MLQQRADEMLQGQPHDARDRVVVWPHGCLPGQERVGAGGVVQLRLERLCLPDGGQAGKVAPQAEGDVQNLPRAAIQWGEARGSGDKKVRSAL